MLKHIPHTAKICCPVLEFLKLILNISKYFNMKKKIYDSNLHCYAVPKRALVSDEADFVIHGKSLDFH